MPIEPDPSEFDFAAVPLRNDGEDLVAWGANLLPGTVLAAYRHGLFPMPLQGSLGWFSPRRRGVLPLDGLIVSRSLRRSLRRYDVRVDSAFEAVLRACADPRRPDGWINQDVVSAYARLHELGWAHSVECWDGERLVGGLYGLEVGGLFAGESMFHTAVDASKVALVALVERLRAAGGGRLLDVQWATAHLASLGVVEIDRSDYLRRLAGALTLPPSFSDPSGDRAGPASR